MTLSFNSVQAMILWLEQHGYEVTQVRSGQLDGLLRHMDEENPNFMKPLPEVKK